MPSSARSPQDSSLRLLAALSALLALFHLPTARAEDQVDMLDSMRPEIGHTVEHAVELSDEEKERRRIAAQEAERKLEDRKFYAYWMAEGRIDTRERADEVLGLANAELKEIEKALGTYSEWCQTKFLVNACINEARKKSFEREREIRLVMQKANDVVRAARTEEIKARREAERNRPPAEPMHLREPRLKERAEPTPIAPKTVKEPSEPVQWAPKQVKEPKAPSPVEPKRPEAPKAPDPLEAKSVKPAKAPDPISSAKPEAAQALDRAEQEAANEAYYEEKQRKARERLERAQEQAAKRRAEREAKQKQLEESLKEREDAQRRYEERRDERSSGLSKYF